MTGQGEGGREMKRSEEVGGLEEVMARWRFPRTSWTQVILIGIK